MHDLDRMMYETAPHAEDAPGVGEWQQGESEQGEEEDFLGTLGSMLGGSQGEYQETPELTELHEMLGMPAHQSIADGSGSSGQGAGSPRHLQELELASELLEVTSEEELDRFLADLIRGAATTASNFAQSDTGRALGGVLRSTAKRALPAVAGAIGGKLGPGGADWGRRAGAAAADLFGLELEGLSSEDREFELARAFIRFAQAACRNAAKAPSDAPTSAGVRAAVTSAARHHAPGLLPLITGRGRAGEASNGTRPPAAGGPPPPAAQAAGPAEAAQSGRWIRRGNAIVLLGA